MARKSRKPGVAPVAPVTQEIIYNTAIYARLSYDNKEKPDNESLENQQLLLEQYIADKPEFNLKRVFVDNDETGTNFVRPAWNNLIADCKDGKINCVIVKDLSRIGRNYIETGEYLDKIFPLLGVRVIAVNDNYDNLGITYNEQFIANIKNLVNDIYSKDLGRKIKASIKVRQNKGVFLGGVAPYGYIKILDRSNKIIIDPETAPIVRQMFRWKADGMGHSHIARQLNSAGIPTPRQYQCAKGLIKSNRHSDAKWTVATVQKILRNLIYAGHTAQNIYSGIDYFVVENTHEPIVTQELFDAVQSVMDSRQAHYKEIQGRHSDIVNPEKPLAGLVYCSDCGKMLFRKRQIYKNADNNCWVYHCPTAEKLHDCPHKHIHEFELNKAVFDAIRIELQRCADISGIIEKLNRADVHKVRLSAFDTELEDSVRELKRIESLRQSVYEDYAAGVLNASEYQYAIAKYDKDRDRLNSRIVEVKRNKEDYEQRSTGANKWLVAFSQFTGATALTADMAQALIERIEISNRNCVTVFFKFRDEYEALCGVA